MGRATDDEHAVGEPDSLKTTGFTTVSCAVGGRMLGWLCLHDPLRPGVRDAVASLTSLGIRSVLLSGDRPAAVAGVAEASGVGEHHSRLLPTDKVHRVRAWQRAGETVLMVGDGINDAPALATADVGATIGPGTDLAKETAGVTLLGSRLETIPWLIHYAGRVRRTIQWNLVWAFGYNVLGVGLAVAGLLQPVLAALAMVLSSLLVVGNSLRLRSASGASPASDTFRSPRIVALHAHPEPRDAAGSHRPRELSVG